MKDPGFKYNLVWLLSIVSLAMVGTAGAEAPETGPKKSGSSRGRPQVIYHLPPSSPYAATLHSQAKGQNNELPTDNSLPSQIAPPSAPQQQTPLPSIQERRVSPKLKSNRSRPRSRSVAKPPGHGNPHANKSHKK